MVSAPCANSWSRHFFRTPLHSFVSTCKLLNNFNEQSPCAVITPSKTSEWEGRSAVMSKLRCFYSVISARSTSLRTPKLSSFTLFQPSLLLKNTTNFLKVASPDQLNALLKFHLLLRPIYYKIWYNHTLRTIWRSIKIKFAPDIIVWNLIALFF